MEKILFFDLETTGLDPVKCAIHQIAGKIVIDGVERECFNYKVRPFEGAVIDDIALEVAGVTLGDIMLYPTMESVYEELIRTLDKYVNKYDKHDKMFMAGYNVAVFDTPFLREFFKMNGNPYFGSYFWSVPIDVIILAQAKLMNCRASMKDFKQGTVAAQLGIALNEDKLHDAWYDITICEQIYENVMGVKIKKGNLFNNG